MSLSFLTNGRTQDFLLFKIQNDNSLYDLSSLPQKDRVDTGFITLARHFTLYVVCARAMRLYLQSNLS